jgi:DoxX-like family
VFVLAAILSVLLAIAMAGSAARKATSASSSMELRDRLAVPPPLWSTIGALEVCAALGLLAGLAVAWLGVAAAVGVALLMAGAVIAHLRQHIAGAALTPPAVLFVVAVAAALTRTVTS